MYKDEQLFPISCLRDLHPRIHLYRIILHAQAKGRRRCCPSCGAHSVVKNRYLLRDFVELPIGGKRVTRRMKVQRYKCKEYDFDQQENIHFATSSRSYTHRFAKYVVDLLRGMTLQDVSNHLGVSWDTVKEIHSSYLEHHTVLLLWMVWRI